MTTMVRNAHIDCGPAQPTGNAQAMVAASTCAIQQVAQYKAARRKAIHTLWPPNLADAKPAQYKDIPGIQQNKTTHAVRPANKLDTTLASYVRKTIGSWGRWRGRRTVRSDPMSLERSGDVWHEPGERMDRRNPGKGSIVPGDRRRNSSRPENRKMPTQQQRVTEHESRATMKTLQMPRGRPQPASLSHRGNGAW